MGTSIMSASRQRAHWFAFAIATSVMLLGCGEDRIVASDEEGQNLTAVAKQSSATTFWSGPYRVTVGGSQFNTPSAVEPEPFNGQLHIFYRGSSTNRVGRLSMTTGRVFTNHGAINSNERTLGKPAAVVYNSKLHLVYMGDNKIDDLYRIGHMSMNASGAWSSATVLTSGGSTVYTAAAPEAYTWNSNLYVMGNSPTVINAELAFVWWEGRLIESPVQLIGVGYAGLADEIYSNPTVTAGIYLDGSSQEVYYLYKSFANSTLLKSQIEPYLLENTIPDANTSNGPSSVVHGGKIHMAYRGTNNAIYYKVYDTAIHAWSSTEHLGTYTGATPSVTVFDNKLYIFFRNDDNNELWYMYSSL